MPASLLRGGEHRQRGERPGNVPCVQQLWSREGGCSDGPGVPGKLLSGIRESRLTRGSAVREIWCQSLGTHKESCQLTHKLPAVTPEGAWPMCLGQVQRGLCLVTQVSSRGDEVH